MKAAIKSTGRRRPLTTAESMLAGLIAGSATVILTNPIWVVNTRQTARRDVDEDEHDISKLSPSGAAKVVTQRATGFLKILANIVKTEGISALWSGVIPALVLVINPIIQYTLFEELKTKLETRRGSKVTPNDAFVLGALGKLMATGITYPYSIPSMTPLMIVTIKARMQLKQSNDVSQQYNGTIAAIRKIIKEEGPKGLYKGNILHFLLTQGVAPKLTQSVLNAAFLFMFKEFFFNSSKALLQSRLNHGPTVLDAAKLHKR